MNPRTPLRPLARILDARARGENPDVIEAENIRNRHEVMRDKARARAESRLLLLVMGFCAAFLTIGIRMGALASSEPEEPRILTTGKGIQSQRADIVDRNGALLATNFVTHALYLHPREVIDAEKAIRELAVIFPDMKEDWLRRQFDPSSSFRWLRRKLSPEQMQAVHDIGEPGLLFGPREMRLYPNDRMAAHVLGGSRFGDEGVHSAEVIGVAGLERALDERLREPSRLDEPVQLSIDLSVQAAMTEVLHSGMMLLNAKGAAGILMDAHNGEVISMVSLPDFDPNDRPLPPTEGDPADSPIFNRALQGVYELGSVMKAFPVAQALELGLVNPDTMIDTRPMQMGRFRIRDYRNYGAENSVTDVMVKSSNIGTTRIIQRVGATRQQAFLKELGFLDPMNIELVEAARARPLVPQRWSDIHSATISYGHGLSASPMHLASAYATLVNGGYRVEPTLVKRQGEVPRGPQIIKTQTSDQMREMLRQVVIRGSARQTDVAGYHVGGKTGTADKMKPTGGYFKDKVMANFAGAFPMDDPRYVIIVSLDEPVETSGTEARRTAGWTAVPVTAEIIRRIAPMLDMRPAMVEAVVPTGVTRVRN